MFRVRDSKSLGTKGVRMGKMMVSPVQVEGVLQARHKAVVHL